MKHNFGITLLLTISSAAAALGIQYDERKTLYIGSFVLDPDISFVVDGIIYGQNRALEFINNSSDILSGYKLDVVQRWTSTEASDGLWQLYDALYGHDSFLFMTPNTYSSLAQSMCETSNYYNLVQVACCTESPAFQNRQRYPQFYQITTGINIINPTRIELMKMFKWKRVALIYENEEFYDLNFKALTADLEEEDIEVVTVENIADKKLIPTHIANLKAYRQGLFGRKYQWMFTGWLQGQWWRQPDVDCTVEEMDIVTDGYFGIRGLTIANDFNLVNFNGIKPSEEVIADYIYMRENPNFNEYVFQTYDAFMTMALTLNASIQPLQEMMPTKRLEDFTYDNGQDILSIFQEEIKKLNFYGITGPVRFSDAGSREADVVVEQVQDGHLERVMVHNPRENVIIEMDRQFIWKGDLPPVDGVIIKRVATEISSWLVYTLLPMSFVGIILSLVLLTLHIINKNRRVIKMSVWRLNSLVAVGCILSYISVILMVAENSGLADDKSKLFLCKVRSLILPISVSLAFGGLFVKSYRVSMIFKIAVNKFKKVNLSDKRLVFSVFLFTIVDLLIFVSWNLVDPMKIQSTIVRTEMTYDANGNDLKLEYTSGECSSDYLNIWFGLLLVFKGALMVFGVFIAWDTRNIGITALNESKQIAFAVYCVSIISVVAIAVVFMTDISNDALYGSIAMFLIVGSSVILITVFVPKILLLRIPDENIRIKIADLDTFQDRTNLQSSATYQQELQEKRQELSRLLALSDSTNEVHLRALKETARQ
ncbi:gamma-aminobutyric acid type B receptor subunit 2-like isoform X2 [Anneissia japonica]|uniref:gamma-aminobutyric acid type B receptor subunit 2-like isoform X2 n=1 Tax=Anneissia japonica TaxID=1529436 RepID=UPI0014255F7E|nr:gamma-aminobutyric acid type B receptor subunit 2-like isoform X2 [Anneissia japonica]